MKKVTKEGITMEISEVVIDHDQVLVSVITTSETALVDYAGPGGSIYINGENINRGMYVYESTLVDEYTGHALLVFPTYEALEGELDIKLQLNSPIMGVERSPHWDYEFSATGETLGEDAIVEDLNQVITIANGDEITLTKYTSNAYLDRVHFELLRGSEEFKSYTVEGVDQEGTAVEFAWRMMSEDQGSMLPTEASLEAVRNAETLTLSLYADGEQVGEAFTINK